MNFVSELDALNPSSKYLLCLDTIIELVKLYPRSGIDEFILIYTAYMAGVTWMFKYLFIFMHSLV